MRCHQCDYSLWNVHGRTCPECGASFNPADYKFRPNLVEFCCDSCGQQYYGTDQNGLLVPPEFECVKCGAHCSMAQNMVLRAAPGADEGEVQADELPWSRRKVIGRWRAAWRTLWLSIGAPSKVGRGLRGVPETGAGAWLLMVCVPSIALVLLGGVAVGIIGLFSGLGGRRGLPNSGQLLEFVTTIGQFVVVPLVLFLLAVWICAFVTWVVARMGQKDLRFSTVFACWAFASSPAVFLAIPCLGAYCVGPALVVWVPILAGMMLRECCTSRTRLVVIGVVIPPALVFLLGAAGMAALFVALNQMTAARASSAVPPAVVGANQAASPDSDAEAETGADGAPSADPNDADGGTSP